MVTKLFKAILKIASQALPQHRGSSPPCSVPLFPSKVFLPSEIPSPKPTNLGVSKLRAVTGTASQLFSPSSALHFQPSEAQDPQGLIASQTFPPFDKALTFVQQPNKAHTQVLPATTVSASVCLQPLCGSALAVLWLGERLVPWDGGAILILGGLGLVLSDTANETTAALEHLVNVPSLGTLETGGTIDQVPWGQDSRDTTTSLTSSFMSAVNNVAQPQLSALHLSFCTAWLCSVFHQDRAWCL
jgi:hypothetical protein